MTDIDLEEITVQRREVEVEGRIHAADKDPPAGTREGKERRQSGETQNSASGDDLRQTQHHIPLISNGSQDHGVLRGGENGEPSGHPADGKDRELSQEGLRAQFYEHYRKEVREYDKEFMKKNDEEYLNTAQIFAGLFSAVTSAFIAQVQPQLQPDPNQEAAALLRVLLYKMDNTTFGGDIPTIPLWTTPPHTIVHVQAMLYASLATSLFSAFLAMLGKQWLSRYASTDIRGTPIERSQDRQRKLGGMITWHFDLVMESLPLLLQVALLLLGCALSLYLWGIDVAVACVVIGVTALGVIFYAFIVVAGTTSASCPYQTPWARILRHIHHRTLPHIIYHILPYVRYHVLPHTLGLFRSAFRAFIRKSTCLLLFSGRAWDGWLDWRRNIFLVLNFLLCFTFLLADDAHRLIRTMIKALIALARRVCSWIRSACTARARKSNQKVAILDSQCISWVLQTSLEKGIRLSALKFLATISTSTDFTPTLVLGCFGIIVDSVKASEKNLVIVQGMDQLVELSVKCFFLACSHLSAMDPMSSILTGVLRHYRRIFPPDLDFSDLPFPHTLGAIHEAIYSDREVVVPIEWRDYKPANHEDIAVAYALSKLSWSEYQRGNFGRIPPLCLSFALYYLSQDPLPPPPITTNCLMIIAIYLGCDVPKNTVLGESARPEEVSDLIIQKFSTVNHRYPIRWKPKVIDALFWYAVNRERCGDTSLFDAILLLKKGQFDRCGSLELLWYSGVSKIFIYASPRAIVLTGPYVHWRRKSSDTDAQDLIFKWATATASVAPRTEVGQDVVDTLLQIAADPTLRSFIPADIWSWLNERPFLSPTCRGLLSAGDCDIIRTVRTLNDIGVLTSYLIMIWSESRHLNHSGHPEMRTSLREDFSGVGMDSHRAELIQRLDYILGKLDWRSERLNEGWLWRCEVGRYLPVMKERYGQFRRILQQVDQEATEILNRSHSTFMCALPLPCS